MVIGETVLGAVLQVVIDKLASKEVINFFRHSKYDQSLAHKLKTVMLAAEKLILDAEQKQMTDRAVKKWLEELKHWFYRAEEVMDQISTKALMSSLKLSQETPSLGTKVCKFVPSFCHLLNFSCLRLLEIGGEDVECFPEADEGPGSLPSSLTSLCIKDCPKLRRMDGKSLQTLTLLRQVEIQNCPKLKCLPSFQTLTSLEHLWISNCPKLESFPEEGLPPSLGGLWISRCPMVEKKCKSKKGKDWSKIHHIPQICINGRCI